MGPFVSVRGVRAAVCAVTGSLSTRLGCVRFLSLRRAGATAVAARACHCGCACLGPGPGSTGSAAPRPVGSAALAGGFFSR